MENDNKREKKKETHGEHMDEKYKSKAFHTEQRHIKDSLVGIHTRARTQRSNAVVNAVVNTAVINTNQRQTLKREFLAGSGGLSFLPGLRDCSFHLFLLLLTCEHNRKCNTTESNYRGPRWTSITNISFIVVIFQNTLHCF